MTTKEFDSVSAIMAYESGEADEEQVLELFQYLVDTGLAWSLQGSYGRTARHLLDEGLIEGPVVKTAYKPHTIPPECSPHDNPRMRDAPGYTG